MSFNSNPYARSLHRSSMYVQIIQESGERSRDDVSLCEFLPKGTRQGSRPGRGGRKEPHSVCTGKFNQLLLMYFWCSVKIDYLRLSVGKSFSD